MSALPLRGRPLAGERRRYAATSYYAWKKPPVIIEVMRRHSRAKASALAVGTVFVPFTVLIFAMWIFGGPEQRVRGALVRVDLLLLLYPLGAILTGAILGVLEPFVGRSRWRAALTGAVAVLPWFAGIALTTDHGYRDWNGAHTFTIVIMTLVFGPVVGQWVRKD